eukprot:TRINITY_DN4539_c0_g2_i1.p1 TRINITY_DN4539_c0_g2~~TRINITY_DN4539_c0_g2_i1.p1  ORF type:complete len:359 (-),score=64.75 TRINITY_DN4539_c0_g2_i1:500-1576(-)
MMMGSKLRVGIIGAAEIALKNARAIGLADTVEVVAVGSRDIKKAQDFLTLAGLDTSLALQGYDAVLEADIDAMYIPLPTGLHIEWVKKCAAKKIHILCEKPVVTNLQELQELEQVVMESGIQFMDGTMWMHNPRTPLIRQKLHDEQVIGEKRLIMSTVSFVADPEFLMNNIRVKKELDGLGSLGDMGWYSIRSALLAFDFEMPVKCQAHPCPTINNADVVTNCGATVLWEDGKKLVFVAAFDMCWNNRFQVFGDKATLRVDDFIIPNNEESCEFFVTSKHKLIEGATGSEVQEQRIVVNSEKPQESYMWEKFASLIKNIQEGGKPDYYWLEICKKTQKIVCAIQESIDKNCALVDVPK